jgi:pyruvate formate lyase activating enzyme
MIHDFIKTSFVDYPKLISTVIFTSGCNFRCPFCHNGSLVNFKTGELSVTNRFFEHVEKRKKVLDGVVITGGEPTLHSGLPDLVGSLKNLGLKVKLDTNGTNPDMLSQAIDAGIDYVAMDLKNDFESYAHTIGLDVSPVENIRRSMHLLRTASVEYEFRTTIMKEFHSGQVLDRMMEMIEPGELWVIQNYRYSDEQLKSTMFTSFSPLELMEIRDRLRTKSIDTRIELR